MLVQQKQTYSTKEAADRWGVSRLTVIRALRAGKLRAVRLGPRGHYLIPAREIERIERCKSRR